jgi:hypothetical protein
MSSTSLSVSARMTRSSPLLAAFNDCLPRAQPGFSSEDRRVKACAMANDSIRKRLIGTWRLVAVETEDISTGEKFPAWGDNPAGFINYAPDGRMMVINVRSDRKKPAGAVPSAAEAADLFMSMLAYAGTYTIDGNEVTHHIEISWNEAWSGSHQVRIARFDGNRVHLSTRPSPDLASGRMSVRTMTWERLQ